MDPKERTKEFVPMTLKTYGVFLFFLFFKIDKIRF